MWSQKIALDRISALAVKMVWAQQHPKQITVMEHNAPAFYEAEFTAERNYQQLIAIYQDAITVVKTQKCPYKIEP